LSGFPPQAGGIVAVLGSTTMTVSRLRPYTTTVFAEMSALAARIGAVNLGQGFPDEDGPPAMLKAAQDAIAEGANQYPPSSTTLTPTCW
jgi:N-succinyldiaminopimelate aminotransferase